MCNGIERKKKQGGKTKMTQQEYENKIKELQDELEQLKAAKIAAEQPKRWKPNIDEEYYIVSAEAGELIKTEWNDDALDEWYYLTGNCFKTKEEAEEYKKQIEYTARYKNYIEEHSEPIDWNNRNQGKWGAYYDCVDEKISTDGTKIFKEQGKIYASSEEIIEDAIKEIGEDNFKKYVLGVK